MCGIFNRGRRIPWPLKVAGVLIFIPGLLILGTWVTMLLWNALMPVLFGLSVITFWQSMGILVLAKILFGGHHGGRGHFPRKPQFKDREAWKEHMRNKFADRESGGYGSHGRHSGRGPGGRWSEDNDVDSESGGAGNRPAGDEPES